jgi:hypothetical protein
MTAASSLAYRFRPNKAVDRELFLSLLGRLAAALNIESYRYIGLGGPFLEDFRLIHSRLGIDDMVCVEMEDNVHLRQKFNRPVECIACVHSSLEEYIDSTEFDRPVIIWFDYSDPKTMTDQIERFGRTVGEMPVNSVLRMTLNANPSSLGDPNPEEVAARVGNQPVQEWRLERFRERLGNLFPSDLKAEGMTFKQFGHSVLKALYISVERTALSFTDRRIVWILATHYADGQPMVTATLVVTSRDDVLIKPIVDSWRFSSLPVTPLKLDMPALSTIERLTMESCQNPRERMGYDLPVSDLGENPYEAFRRFYRMYPHFARVDL